MNTEIGSHKVILFYVYINTNLYFRIYSDPTVRSVRCRETGPPRGGSFCGRLCLLRTYANYPGHRICAFGDVQ